MPQNKNLSTEWQEVRDKYLHTLGNLTLTGYNSEFGDKPFKEKKELLDEAKTKVVTLYLDVKNRDTWNQEAIESRAKRLADMIVEMFPIVPPEHEIFFNDPNYKEYTCENPEDATYKTPNYYVLLGERVASTNFASILRSLIETLYKLDSSIIENMAENNEQIVAWSQNIMFSYNSENTTGGNQKIRNTDIYERPTNKNQILN
ncbi:MAG: HNH endonuclease family protein [Ruminococcus flavefaciens]|nr:HNH endonuclease family protein [Ruminococcus flavefaciens]MCM1362388.1 HNH endonuclease family protein [Clostridiales bacterium]